MSAMMYLLRVYENDAMERKQIRLSGMSCTSFWTNIAYVPRRQSLPVVAYRLNGYVVTFRHANSPVP